MVRTAARLLKYAAYGLLVFTGVVFAVSNRQPVDLTFYPLPYSVSFPLYLLALLIFGIGAFAGWGLVRFSLLRERHRARKNARRVEALENELAALRSEQLLRSQQSSAAPSSTVKAAPLSLAK